MDDIIKKLSPDQRKKVEARAAERIAEEMTLRERRHAPQANAGQDGQEARDYAGQRCAKP